MEFMFQFVDEILISVALGGIIGLEREFSHKAAGLRTLILICLGSTLIMVLSAGMTGLFSPGDIGAHLAIDPGRIAAGVVTGIGFLGAGTIIRSRGSVQGLTTAATIWVTAAIGMAIGLGQVPLAVFGTILVVSILGGVGLLEKVMKTKCRLAYFFVQGEESEALVEKIREAMRSSHIDPEGLHVERARDQITIRFAICQTGSTHRAILEQLKALPEVQIARYL